MEKANVFIISEDGTYLEKELIDLIVETLSSTYEAVNAPEINHIMMKCAHKNGTPVRNAYNDPLYLVGEIHESEYEPIVVAVDADDDGFPKPKFFVDKIEIDSLVAELEANKDVDAWKTAIKVNKILRSTQE